jgi:hypothetical protein
MVRKIEPEPDSEDERVEFIEQRVCELGAGSGMTADDVVMGYALVELYLEATETGRRKMLAGMSPGLKAEVRRLADDVSKRFSRSGRS